MLKTHIGDKVDIVEMDLLRSSFGSENEGSITICEIRNHCERHSNDDVRYQTRKVTKSCIWETDRKTKEATL